MPSVFVQVVSLPLGWSPLLPFLAIQSPRGDTRGPSVVFEADDMPCPGPLHLSHIADYVYDFCPLPDSDAGVSVLVIIVLVILSILLSSFLYCIVYQFLFLFQPFTMPSLF